MGTLTIGQVVARVLGRLLEKSWPAESMLASRVREARTKHEVSVIGAWSRGIADELEVHADVRAVGRGFNHYALDLGRWWIAEISSWRGEFPKIAFRSSFQC